jgi:hypothetical protein
LQDIISAGFGFGLSVAELTRIWNTYLRPNAQILGAISADGPRNYVRQTVILLNHGDREGQFGVSGGSINKQVCNVITLNTTKTLADVLSTITIPTVVISCSCFAHTLFHKIATLKPPKDV